MEWLNYGMMEWWKDGTVNKGMMEWWNNGMMELWIMELWDEGMLELWNDGILKNIFFIFLDFPRLSIIFGDSVNKASPALHYIWFGWQRGRGRYLWSWSLSKWPGNICICLTPPHVIKEKYLFHDIICQQPKKSLRPHGRYSIINLVFWGINFDSGKWNRTFLLQNYLHCSHHCRLSFK